MEIECVWKLHITYPTNITFNREKKANWHKWEAGAWEHLSHWFQKTFAFHKSLINWVMYNMYNNVFWLNIQLGLTLYRKY